jgi:hypothetical protein
MTEQVIHDLAIATQQVKLTFPQVDQESSFMSLLREIGLTLEPAQGQAKMPVIDHAELPSPN